MSSRSVFGLLALAALWGGSFICLSIAPSFKGFTRSRLNIMLPVYSKATPKPRLIKMKIKSVTLFFLCLTALGVTAQSSRGLDNSNHERLCEYDGKIYAIGLSLITQDKATLTCKSYDAIIPKTADRLIDGYAYWEKQMPNAKAGIELPRALSGVSLP